MANAIKVVKVNRRELLGGLAAMGLSGLILACKSKPKEAKPNAKTPAGSNKEEASDHANGQAKLTHRPAVAYEVTPFLSLGEDGILRIIVARSEMGQGTRTAMAMLVAEELDLPWSDVQVLQGNADERYGSQHTDGSTSARTQYRPLRTMGAAARMMLIEAAAKRWKVEAKSVTTRAGQVHHPDQKQSLRYAELIEDASKLDVPEKPKLKPEKSFQLIGKTVPGIDTPDFVRGTANYGIDTRIEGLRIVSVERCPYRRGRLESVDDSAAKAIAGVEQVLKIDPVPAPVNGPASVAVVAKNTWAAMQGREALKCVWTPGEYGKIDSKTFDAQLLANMDKDGTTVRSEGDVSNDAMAAKGYTQLSRDYRVGYLPHQPMEPLACTAHVTDKKAEIWAPTQSPQTARREVAKALKIDENDVTLHVTLLGGGFGRKGKTDFIVEAALIAQKANVPIKVIWSREDEIQHGFYRPAAMQRISAAVDKQGKIQAWSHRASFGSIASTFNAKSLMPAWWETAQGLTTMPLDIPNIHVSVVPVDSPLRIGWLRSVHHLFHAQSVCCFVDELAHANQRDPIEYYLEHLGQRGNVEITSLDAKRPHRFDLARLRKVIERVKEISKFDSKKSMGFAAHPSFGSYVATVVQVEADASGGLRTTKVWSVVDCGRVLHPHHALGQVEGGVIFGLSAAYYGQVELEEGQVKQSNFHDLPVCRMDSTPEMVVEFIEGDKNPSGLGEPGVPPVAPALINAIYAATKKRIYDLPLNQYFKV